jgi:ligand-binding sensor domain-containing protein
MRKYYLFHSLIAFIFITYGYGQVSTNDLKPNPIIIRTPSPSGFHFNMVEDTTLVSQYIRSIFQDSKGNFWFGTAFEGLCKYDGASLTYYTELDVFAASSVHAIAEDKKANLWFGTDQGVFKYDGKKFTNYREKAGLSNLNVSRNGIFVDKDDHLWVATNGGAFRYHLSADTLGGKCFTPFPLLALTIPFTSDERIGNILQDKAGNLWFASMENGIYRFDGKSVTTIFEKEINKNSYGSMILDKMGNIWFTVLGKGVCMYDGKTFTNYTTADGLGGNETWLIYEDRMGNIWISARGSITRYDGKNFTVFTIKDGINCCVQSMYQDKVGNMWFGAGNGLNRLEGNRFIQVKQKGPW